jgi:hypothetical protein
VPVKALSPASAEGGGDLTGRLAGGRAAGSPTVASSPMRDPGGQNASRVIR